MKPCPYNKWETNFYMYLFKDLKLQQQKINLLGHFDSYKCKYAIKTMWTRETSVHLHYHELVYHLL